MHTPTTLPASLPDLSRECTDPDSRWSRYKLCELIIGTGTVCVPRADIVRPILVVSLSYLPLLVAELTADTIYVFELAVVGSELVQCYPPSLERRLHAMQTLVYVRGMLAEPGLLPAPAWCTPARRLPGALAWRALSGRLPASDWRAPARARALPPRPRARFRAPTPPGPRGTRCYALFTGGGWGRFE
jgi:hypothetical protein